MPVFNAFISTRPRTARRQKEDSPATAGAAKVSSVTARSKSELQSLGEKLGFEVRPLTMAGIRAMSSQELLWHESENSANYLAALELPGKIAEGKEIDSQWAVKRMFEDRATPEEFANAIKITQSFGDRFPQGQFAALPENRTKLIGWLEKQNLPITVENLAAGFAELSMAGDLVLSAAVLGDDRQLSGELLRTYPRLHELIQPQHMPTAQEKMSADEYWKAHPELHSKKIPFLVAQGFEQAERTFMAMHPEYISTKNSCDKIHAQLQEWKISISPQSLEAAWKHLVEKGELQIDRSKVVQGQAVKLTDLGGRR